MSTNRNTLYLEDKELDKLVMDIFDTVEKRVSKKQAMYMEDRSVNTEGAAPEHEKASEPNAGNLFGGEEEKFIKDAVTWLAPRANKDEIISQIWSILTDSEPESFFADKSDEAGNQSGQSKQPDGDRQPDARPDKRH